MSYPGNTTLTREMQERILSTFQQTLEAAATGNRQEASLGCDFILRLDSLFGPARELQERLAAGEGPVATADLAEAVGLATGEAAPGEPEAAPAAAPAEAIPPLADPAAAAAAAAAQPPDIDDLADLDVEMGLTEPAPEQPEAAAGPQAATTPPAPEPGAAAAPAPPVPPPVDELEDLDLGLGDSTQPAAPTPAEPAPQPVSEAAAPAPPPAPEAPAASAAPAGPVEVDELEDLDLGLGDSFQPAAPAAAAEVPAPAPPAAEPEPPAPGDPSAPAEPAGEAPAAAPGEPAPGEPPAAAPPLEGGEIPLHSEPAAQLDSESQQRIDDLLAEGQEAYDAGEYQGAIDAWSRIFLIDIDHAEANRRIEQARKLKAEADRKVEEKFHEGLAHLESGETDAAADSFRAVLGMQSSHLQARDYLEKLEAGEVPVPAEMPQPAGEELEADEFEPGEMEDLGEAEERPKPKVDRGSKAVGERVVTVKKSPFKSKSFLAVAAAGLIAVLGGAWYLFNNWSSLFPNSGQEAPVAPAPDPLARAKGLHAEGRTPIAIAQLRRLPPDNPQYDEAQALIAQWELEQAPAEVSTEGPSPQEQARRGALIAEAQAAAERREFLRTSELLSEAATVAPLAGAEVQLLARADEQLQELQQFITIFREGEWDMALRDLWLLHESDPENRDVTRLLIDSYYNLGLRALQRKDVREAAEQFKEALSLNPEDPELLRLADFAATYQTRSTDLLYRIFVKYQPFR